MKEENTKTKPSNEQNRQPVDREARKAKNAKRRQEIIRKRKALLAAAIAAVAVVIIIVFVVVTKLLSKGADTSTLTINSDGSVVCEEVSDFDQDYYTASSLKTYIKDSVSAYNSENSTDIQVNKVKVSDQEAYAKITYGSVSEYANFTGFPLYSGTVAAAINDGYTFDDAFVAVADGAKGDSVEAIDVASNKEYNVIIVKENITVNVPGTIVYVSDNNTAIVDESTVTIAQVDGNEDATQITYIVYQVAE